MNGQTALDLLMSRLGARTDADLRAIALLEMQLVQETKLEQGPIKPWWIIKDDGTLVATPGTRGIALPSDFIAESEEEEGSVYIVDSNGAQHELTKKTWDENVGWHGLEATSDLPKNYSLIGSKFMLFPIPNLASTINFHYYARQTLPADNTTETTWLKWASDLLIAETGLAVAGLHVQVEEAILARFKDDITRAWDRINRENVSRAEANMSRRMG